MIGNGYGNNWKKRKRAESLLMKDLKPTLDKQD